MEGGATGRTGAAAVVVAVEWEVVKTMNVLVAVDDSEESFYALRWVLDKLLKPETVGEPAFNKVVTIIHVVEPLPRYVEESARKAQEQNAARILSRAFEICRENLVNAKTIVLEGDPKDKICRAVEEMNIDLLAVGSRGLGQIKRAFLGSVSDYCTHYAKCAVLVVKPPHKRT